MADCRDDEERYARSEAGRQRRKKKVDEAEAEKRLKTLYAHLLLRILCFEYKVVSIDYFMDKMALYEANDYIKCMKYVDRIPRELERYSNYIYIQSNTKKELKPKDILELPWDTDEFAEHEFNEADRQALESKAMKLKEMIDSGKMKLEKWI